MAFMIHPSAAPHLRSMNSAPNQLCRNCYAAHLKCLNSRCVGHSYMFVIADTTAPAHKHTVHVNYAWPSLESCTYERFSAGMEMHVATPNGNVVVDVMDSCFVLKTKALQGATKLTHCAHYYFNRTCELGPDCKFIHAVFVDPDAVPGQRAPGPSQMGDGREAQFSKRQREAAAAAARAVKQHTKSSDAPTLRRCGRFVTHVTPCQQQQRSVDVNAAVPIAPKVATAVVVTATPVSAPSVQASSVQNARSPQSSSSVSSTSAHRRHTYRYDPYSKTQPMLVLCCA